ncbi:MAG: aminopeptidase [Halobacteria archaeon]
MDSRIREHASILVNWCTEIESDDDVLITASPEAEDLVLALHEKIGEKGAEPVTLYSRSENSRAFLKNHDGEFRLPEHKKALYEETDVAIRIRSDPNQMAMNDVPGELLAERSRVNQPLQEIMLSKRWCLTQHPTDSHAQLAEMSLEEYKNFVYGAINRDWSDVEEYQQELTDRLEDASEVRISTPETEIEMSVEGMHAVNSCGRHNMPSGEVFTAPVPTSVEGEVHFDKPLVHQGHEIEDVRMEFEDGEVSEYSAGSEEDEEVLSDLLETDDGARRLGELGIGTNREIDRFTHNMLFDEKMGDTVHMALGRAYDENVGDDREKNGSAVHVDMITSVDEGRIEFDGEVVQQDGEFVWE